MTRMLFSLPLLAAREPVAEMQVMRDRGLVGPGGGHPGKRTAGACLLDQGSGKSLQNLRRKKENPRILEETYAMTESRRLIP